jgi:hypothetical protein
MILLDDGIRTRTNAIREMHIFLKCIFVHIHPCARKSIRAENEDNNCWSAYKLHVQYSFVTTTSTSNLVHAHSRRHKITRPTKTRTKYGWEWIAFTYSSNDNHRWKPYGKTNSQRHSSSLCIFRMGVDCWSTIQTHQNCDQERETLQHDTEWSKKRGRPKGTEVGIWIKNNNLGKTVRLHPQRP